MPATATKNDQTVSAYVEKSLALSRTVMDNAADMASSALNIPEHIVGQVTPQPAQKVVALPVTTARRVLEDVASAQRSLLG